MSSKYKNLFITKYEANTPASQKSRSHYELAINFSNTDYSQALIEIDKAIELEATMENLLMKSSLLRWSWELEEATEVLDALIAQFH